MAQRWRFGRGALLFLLLSGCAAIETPPAQPTSLADAAQRLPEQAAGFKRDSTTEYEKEQPGYGVGVDYATPGRFAAGSVFVYDKGIANIPSDPASAVIEEELSTSVRDILGALPRRDRQRLAERERFTLPVEGGPGLRCALLRGTLVGSPVVQHVCVGGAAGRFMKMQVIMADEQPPPADARAFVIEIAHAVRGGA